MNTNRILKVALFAAGAILVGGLASFKISLNIYNAAEKQLKTEEGVQAQVNSYVISEREARKSAEKLIQQDQRDREFQQRLR